MRFIELCAPAKLGIRILFVAVQFEGVEMAALALVLTVFCISTIVYCNPVIEVSCDYGEYSKWKPGFRPVPTHQCASGYVVVEKRNRTTLSGDCDNQTEERIAECKYNRVC